MAPEDTEEEEVLQAPASAPKKPTQGSASAKKANAIDGYDPSPDLAALLAAARQSKNK